MPEVNQASTNDPSQRFGKIFKALMVYCVLVWLWGLGLLMIWPWQKGGEWLPEFPLIAVCSDDTRCIIPYGELNQAKAVGKFKTLQPPSDTGDMAYQQLSVQWKRLQGGVETKVSAWNFQTTVRYRIDEEIPVLVEYQEIGGKVFLIAIGGALLTLIGLYLRKLRGQ